MMQQSRRLIVISIASLLLNSASMSQVESKTGDASSGTKYFIVISPGDTSNPDNMPIVTPGGYTEVDVSPVPLKQVAPVYPSNLLPRKFRGTVWVKCLVNTKGSVVKTEVMKSDNEILNSAAIDAAKQWTFKPATVKGRPVDVWAAIPFRFIGAQ